MKQNLLQALAVLLVCIACQEDEQVYSGRSHVRFTESSDRVVENYSDPADRNANEPIRIPLHVVGSPASVETQVFYRLSGTAELGKDYQILSGDQVVIPAGEYVGYIEVEPINNAVRDNDRTAIFTIDSTSSNIEIGMTDNSIMGRSYRLTITDDDCLQNLKLFTGTWRVQEKINQTTLGNEGQGGLQQEYDIVIRPDFSANNRIIISGFGGIDSAATVFSNLDLCANELIIPEQHVVNSESLSGGVRTLEQGSFSIQEEGEGSISFTYTMDALGTTEWIVTATKR